MYKNSPQQFLLLLGIPSAERREPVDPVLEEVHLAVGGGMEVIIIIMDSVLRRIKTGELDIFSYEVIFLIV